jgi:hypothetical protein
MHHGTFRLGGGSENVLQKSAREKSNAFYEIILDTLTFSSSTGKVFFPVKEILLLGLSTTTQYTLGEFIQCQCSIQGIYIMLFKNSKFFHGLFFSLLFFLLGSLPLHATKIHAAQIEGVDFKDSVIINGQKATLRGTGLLRYMIVIKAYVGAFYLREGIKAKDALGDAERQLVLHYFHAIPAEDFADATTEMIKKNVTIARFNALQPQIAQLNALYKDVKPGDEYIATYVPGVGTELALNGESLGVVAGAEYSAAFFSIWIGKNPIDKGFRDRLLGR